MYRSHTSDESDGYKFQLFFHIRIQYIRDHDRAGWKDFMQGLESKK